MSVSESEDWPNCLNAEFRYSLCDSCERSDCLRSPLWRAQLACLAFIPSVQITAVLTACNCRRP
jgi:hypothetical protein